MAYDEGKGKIHEDFLGLWSSYFICVLGPPYYQGGCIGWVGEVLIVKNNLPTKLPRKSRNIGLLAEFQRCLPDMSGLQPKHVRTSSYPQLNRAYPGSSNIYRTHSAPGPDMFGQAPPSQWLSPSWTYPAEQPGFRGRSLTYPVSRLDKSNSLALTRVRPLHQICPVPRPSSRHGCQTCPGPPGLWHPNG
jgi:hypothetical protein